MTGTEFFAGQRSVKTPSGDIHYVERGSGQVALFVHGVLLNGYLWRHQLAELGDLRRCIAVDLMAHGNTEISVTQDVSVTANAHMLAQFLDALEIDQADLVGNDSGGGICQIFAALYPQRVRSLVLTNCDAHDNWPPEAFKGFVGMVAGGGLAGTLAAMLADKSVYRSPQALASAYERPEAVSDDTIETYLRPHVRSPQRTRDLERFVNAFDYRHTVEIETALRRVRAPTLIAWGTDDVYFDLKWSHWLQEAIPGTRRRVEFKGGRIFFPEERWSEFNQEVRAHWDAASAGWSTWEVSSQTHQRRGSTMPIEIFRALHQGPALLVLPNAWDAASARLIESMGAKAIATTSAGLAWSRGYPDGNALPIDQVIAAARDIARVIRVPLTVDIEAGYSDDPHEAADLVVRILDIGAVGINIEDGAASADLLCKKIAAVRSAAARSGVDLFINARTDMYLRGIASGDAAIAEVIHRASRYRDAGCDGLFVPGLSGGDAMAAIAEAIKPMPLNVMALPNLPSMDALRTHGVRRLSAGSAIAEAALGCTRRLTVALLAGSLGEMFSAAGEYGAVNKLFARDRGGNA